MNSTMDCTIAEALAVVWRQRDDERELRRGEQAIAADQRRRDYEQALRRRAAELIPDAWLAELGELTAVWVGAGDVPALHFEYDGVSYRIKWFDASMLELISGYGYDTVRAYISPSYGFLQVLADIHESACALAQARAEAQAAAQAAAAMHQRCLARIASCRELAQRTTWQWPAGVVARIFRWSWCVAPATGEAEATWDSGYSVSDQLEDGGYVILLPERCRSRVRTIRPAPLALPTVELLAVTSTAELPEGLREPARFVLHGVGYGPAAGYDDDALYVEDEDGSIPIDVGVDRPVRWVRDLVDGHPYV